VLQDILPNLPDDPTERYLLLLKALDLRTQTNKLDDYDPTGEKNGKRHEKQLEFHREGRDHPIRMLAGGNRTGKTVAGSAEDVFHLTGRYPDWWEGRVFRHPTRVWVASNTGETTRDIDQLALLGPLDNLGSGLIPKDDIISITRRQGVSEAVDTALIRNQYGGHSHLQFKSYDQGRLKFQGTSKHVVHLDEEPPLDIFRECQQRTTDTDGLIYLTMTPLMGMSDVCMMFYGDQLKASKIRARIDMTWADNPWLNQKVIEALEADLLPHELEARRDGRPVLGAGKIYPFTREQVSCESFIIPTLWPRAIGMDFGWKATAAVFFAYDEEGDTVYVYDCYKQGGVSPAQHTSAIKRRGDLPVFADPSGWKQVGRQEDGARIVELYQELPDPLDMRQAENAVQAGILECFERFDTGRLKIFSSCLALLEEFDTYHRDEKGKVVKEHDHLMDAMRYGVMHVNDFEVMTRRSGREIIRDTSKRHHTSATDAGY
jgi:phage terminase large subunit-like protein